MNAAKDDGTEAVATTERKRPIAADDLAIDLIEAGDWIGRELRFKRRYKLRSVINTAVELLGDRYKQYNLTPDYLSGIQKTLAALALVERHQTHFMGWTFLSIHRVSDSWTRPSEVAHLCARSAIVSMLRHMTGSAVQHTSGLWGIYIADAGLGMDGLLRAWDIGRIDELHEFHVSFKKDIDDHRAFLSGNTEIARHNRPGLKRS